MRHKLIPAALGTAFAVRPFKFSFALIRENPVRRDRVKLPALDVSPAVAVLRKVKKD
jgi:hypothetical protein